MDIKIIKILIPMSLFLYALNPVLAEGMGIFDVLNETFIGDIKELPYSAGVPDQNMQSSGYIKGWIDIVGFRQMMSENGVDYVPGRPEDYAIVQYDAWAKVDCSGCGVESLRKSMSVSASENYTIARLNVKLVWSLIVSCGKECTRKEFHIETATFEDREKSPITYIPLNQNLSVYITEYNNSLFPQIGINVIEPVGISKLTILYDNNVAEHYLKTGHVEQTRKGVYFTNMSYTDFWKLSGTNITRIDNQVLLNINLTQIDYKRLNISASTPYETIYADPESYNITRLDYKPEEILWNPVLFGFIGIIAVVNGSAYYLCKRMMQGLDLR